MDFETQEAQAKEEQERVLTLFKQARENAGLNMREMAEKMGVSLSAIANWEHKRTRIRDRQVLKACQVLGIDPVFFGPRFADFDPSPVRQEIVQAEAKRPILHLGMDEKEYLPASALTGLNENALRLHIVQGSELAPQIPAGKKVLVDTSIKSVVSAGAYLLKIGNGFGMRFGFLGIDGLVHLKTTDPLFPEDAKLDAESAAKLDVVGMVVKQM